MGFLVSRLSRILQNRTSGVQTLRCDIVQPLEICPLASVSRPAPHSPTFLTSLLKKLSFAGSSLVTC